MSFLVCPFFCPCDSLLVCCLLLGHLLPLGSFGGIYSVMEGRRRRRRAHGASFTITWKFPAQSRIRRTLYSALGLILAVLRESWSVTKQITVYCFFSRLDWQSLTAEAVILPPTVRVRYDGAPTHPPDLWTPSIKSGTQITWLHTRAAKDRNAGKLSMSTRGRTRIMKWMNSFFVKSFFWEGCSRGWRNGFG